MPRYFFEMIDGDDVIPDPEGSDLENEAAARDEALRTLGERVRYELPDGDRREFAVRVLDEDGRPIVLAAISLRVTYPGPFQPDRRERPDEAIRPGGDAGRR